MPFRTMKKHDLRISFVIRAGAPDANMNALCRKYEIALYLNRLLKQQYPDADLRKSPIKDWVAALNNFSIMFEGRI